ncbi:MAG: hypothetical protein HN348_06160 [Proteobacteria bacterium]|mgnify:CR=1 FL=1|jgi:hypothetical protein|nr:hypothetical protein [Pseudomonadota bacterium]
MMRPLLLRPHITASLRAIRRTCRANPACKRQDWLGAPGTPVGFFALRFARESQSTWLIVTLMLISACGQPCDSSMLESERALELTFDEHQEGWGIADCSACHALASIHRHSCLDEVDYEELREWDDDYEGCSTCHGENGAEPR